MPKLQFDFMVENDDAPRDSGVPSFDTTTYIRIYIYIHINTRIYIYIISSFYTSIVGM